MNISKVSKCFGCMACMDRCPKQCIEITEGELGHLYPKVVNGCIDCGLCLKVCPAENSPTFMPARNVWAVWRNDDKLRSESSSGGMASAIAEHIIERGGVVYGCAFVPDFSFRHIRCATKTDLKRLKGSKYVQSDMHGVYKSIAKDLREGLKVLFIGTPCQVAGINIFFSKSLDNLFTIDLICHGVPSVKILKESLPKEIFNQDLDSVEFRVNTEFHFSAKSGISGTVFERPLNKDLFLKAFFTALTYRDSCHTCKFAQEQRISDITLGDFWGLDETVVKDAKKGVSLCMGNTERGCKIVNEVSRITMIERPVSEAVSGNKQLRKPMQENFRTKIFRTLYPKFGFKPSVIFSIPEIVIKSKIVSLLKRN